MPRYSPTKKHAELHPRVLGVIAGDELVLGLGQVEGQAVRLGDPGDEEDDEPDELRDDEPDASAGRGRCPGG